MRRTTGLWALALIALGSAVVAGLPASAQQSVACISHPTFPDSTGLTLSGAATTTGGVLRLTPASGDAVGAAFSTTPLNLTNSLGLDTTFQFRITEPGGIDDGDGQTGADGFALVFVTASGAPTGASGVGIGYSGIPNSVAIEFDTYANKGSAPAADINDPNGNHVGVHTNGPDPNSVLESDALAVATTLPNLSDGATHTARVVYQPPSGATPGLRVFVDDLNTPVLNLSTFNMETTINLNAGQGFLGFTASTGAAWENHDILSWTACTQVTGTTSTTSTAGPTTTAVTATTAPSVTTTTQALITGTTSRAAVTTTTSRVGGLARSGSDPKPAVVLAAVAVVLGVLLVTSNRRPRSGYGGGYPQGR